MIKSLTYYFLAILVAPFLQEAFWRGHFLTIETALLERLPAIRDDYGYMSDVVRADFVAESFREFLADGVINIRFDKFLGMGGYGFIYGGKSVVDGKDVAMKLILENEGDKGHYYPRCTTAWSRYQELMNLRVPYLMATKKPLNVKVASVTRETGDACFCGMEMEAGIPTKTPMFSDLGALARERHTKLFLGFAQKVLQTFAAMHVKEGYYHGDVKPGNLLWVKTATGIEPRLIDFDLTFKKETPNFNPGCLIYTYTHRPPELMAFAKRNTLTEAMKVKYDAYPFNPEFKEEVWSVGLTLKNVYVTNRFYINEQDPTMVGLWNILERMTHEDILQRPTSQEAWEDSLALNLPAALRHII